MFSWPRRVPPFLLVVVFAASFARASVTGFTPAAGWEADSLLLSADVFALADDGRLAVGSIGSGGATITVFNHAAPEGREALNVFRDSGLQYLGSMAFRGADELLIAENGSRKTLLSLDLATGAFVNLAPDNAIRNISQVRVRSTDGSVFAVVANNPGRGAVVQVDTSSPAPNAWKPFLTNIGAGYLGGLAFDGQGNLYVGDTNDPYFMGNSGVVRVYGANGTPLQTIGLEGGGGSGLYDLARAANGDVFATTGTTVTRIANGVSEEFGRFEGMFPFPTELAVDGHGGVIVNGAFTGVGGLFRLRPSASTPVPEPSNVLLLGVGALPLIRRRGGIMK